MVTWNAADQLPRFLDSLAAQGIDDLELLAVDNASADDSVGIVERTWPSARVIRLQRNTGYAQAADRGIQESRGAAVALLNYDVVLGPGYLARCLEALRADDHLGSVQGLLLRPSGDVLDSAGHTMSRGRWARNRGENQAAAGGWAPAATFGVTAAAGVYRRAMLERAREVAGHVLDPAFFAYLEDVDLDWRARWLGWEALVVDGATAEHVRSGSGARSSAAVQRHIIKNRLLVIFRNDDSASLARDFPWVAGQLLARWGLALVTAPSSLLGIVDFLRLLRSQRAVRARIRAARQVPPASMRAWYGRGSGGNPGLAGRTRSAAPSSGE